MTKSKRRLRGRPVPRRWAALLLVAGAALLALEATLLTLPAERATLLAMLLAWAALTGGIFLWSADRQLFSHVLSPVGIFCGSVVAIIGLRMLHHVFFFDSGVTFLNRVVSASELVEASAVILLLALVAAVSATASAARLSRPIPLRESLPAAETSDRRVWTTLTVMLVLGLGAWLVGLADAGASYVEAALHPKGRTEYWAGKGYLEGVIRLVPTAMLTFVWWSRSKSASPWTAWVTLVVLTIVVMATFGQRSRLLYPLLGLVVLVHHLELKLKWRQAVAVLAMLLVLLGGYSAFRRASVEAAAESAASSSILPATGIADVSHQFTKAFLPLDGLVMLVSSDVPNYWGGTYLYVFFQAVPRILADRPEYTSVGRTVTKEVFPRIKAGIPPTFIGELYLNFGFWGSLIGCSLIGAMVGFLQKAYTELRRRTSFAVLALAVLAPDIFLFVWGTATIWFHVWVKDVVILLAVFYGFGLHHRLGGPTRLLAWSTAIARRVTVHRL